MSIRSNVAKDQWNSIQMLSLEMFILYKMHAVGLSAYLLISWNSPVEMRLMLFKQWRQWTERTLKLIVINIKS